MDIFADIRIFFCIKRGTAWAQVDVTPPRDAKPDLVAIGSPDGSARRFIVYRNVGGALPFSLDSEPLGADGFSIGAVAVLDFDNDGDNDIAVCGVGPDTSPNNRYLKNL